MLLVYIMHTVWQVSVYKYRLLEKNYHSILHTLYSPAPDCEYTFDQVWCPKQRVTVEQQKSNDSSGYQ